MPYGGVFGPRTALYVDISHFADPGAPGGAHGPGLVEAATICEKNGCGGITVRLGGDGRGMQDHAVQALKDTVRGKFDCVIALSPGAIEVVHRIKPGQVTIVPQAGDPAGFEGVTDIGQYAAAITDTVKLLHDEGIAVSLLAAPDAAVIDLAKACGADLAQLDTGIYGSAPDKASAQRELDRLYRAADHAAHVGMAITAGRGLTYDNIEAVLNAKGLADVHVGRSIVSRAASVGLALAVGEMLEILD